MATFDERMRAYQAGKGSHPLSNYPTAHGVGRGIGQASRAGTAAVSSIGQAARRGLTAASGATARGYATNIQQLKDYFAGTGRAIGKTLFDVTRGAQVTPAGQPKPPIDRTTRKPAGKTPTKKTKVAEPGFAPSTTILDVQKYTQSPDYLAPEMQRRGVVPHGVYSDKPGHQNIYKSAALTPEQQAEYGKSIFSDTIAGATPEGFEADLSRMRRGGSSLRDLVETAPGQYGQAKASGGVGPYGRTPEQQARIDERVNAYQTATQALIARRGGQASNLPSGGQRFTGFTGPSPTMGLSGVGAVMEGRYIRQQNPDGDYPDSGSGGGVAGGGLADLVAKEYKAIKDLEGEEFGQARRKSRIAALGELVKAAQVDASGKQSGIENLLKQGTLDLAGQRLQSDIEAEQGRQAIDFAQLGGQDPEEWEYQAPQYTDPVPGQAPQLLQPAGIFNKNSGEFRVLQQSGTESPSENWRQEADGFEYRTLPSGEVQRRDKEGNVFRARETE